MTLSHQLKRVYWETTAGCNLRCIHCRRTDVLSKGAPDELTTEQGKNLIDQLAEMGKPVLILSGGEPLFRQDIYELASYAKRHGLPVGISTNGTLVLEHTAKKLKEAGIFYASISLDGTYAKTHDIFRGPGNFDRALRGFRFLKEADIKVQINFTVTKQNVHEVPEMVQLATDLGAYALYLFLLVPVGCGVEIADSQMLSAPEVEKWLEWVNEKNKNGSLPLRTICAPHYYRIEQQHQNGSRKEDNEVVRKGCLAGIHMCFISHKGDVFPCGYLPESCGSVLRTPLQEIWQSSPTFFKLRDEDLLTGRCGACAYKQVCGGCRARAYSTYQDILAEEPFCSYQPDSVTNL